MPASVAETLAPAEPRATVEFAALYAEHAAFVWRSLRRLGVSDRDLDDVCQEVFVVVHRKLATFDATATMRTWLFGIARRVAADHRKRAHVRRETLAAPAELEISQAGAAQAPPVELQRARAVLDEILDELDEAKRAVFVLFELEEMAMAEVAKAVECPLQTAYSRLAAARKQVEGAVRRRQLRGELT
ncbi:MAG TPA: sigma-70 family RNA polymerase sigma factor [Kofleriaceae bacterium]|nr:sigma-70 family RNA polymerase sigma factor [Kofleriaceae bacterium]